MIGTQAQVVFSKTDELTVGLKEFNRERDTRERERERERGMSKEQSRMDKESQNIKRKTQKEGKQK